jgi:hypothetical protein
MPQAAHGRMVEPDVSANVVSGPLAFIRGGLSGAFSEYPTILSERWSADASAFLVVARSVGDPGELVATGEFF